MAHADSTHGMEPLRELAEVLRTERRALVGMATREGLTAEEALECVQDAVCTWLAQRQRVTAPPPELGGTLRVMVRNAARNWRRRHRRLKPHLAIDEEVGLTLGVAGNESDAEQLLAAAEDTLRLQVCVAELREVERAVVSLRLLEERSGEDVALALGLSRAHVDVIVHRAKATLRVCMGVGCGG